MKTLLSTHQSGIVNWNRPITGASGAALLVELVKVVIIVLALFMRPIIVLSKSLSVELEKLA